MSVWVSSAFGHVWSVFSESLIEEIARTISTENTAPRWLRRPELKSPEEEFAAAGMVTFFLPADFTIGFGRRVLTLQHTDRWSTFLTNQAARQHFLSASTSIARLAGAKEILLLPEGTVLADLFCDDIDFRELVRRAHQDWGPPDLDISHIYTPNELQRLGAARVHYFLVGTE